MDRVQLEPAFVLHTIPFKNTSLIVDLFTRQYGRVSVVAKSARGPKSRYRGLLQPFSLLLVNWSGRSELKSLGNIELQGVSYRYTAKKLFCAYYLNEIMMRLIAKDDPYPLIFDAYTNVLNNLDLSNTVEPSLREFEFLLLDRLGYAISFDVNSKQVYFLSDEGFVHTQEEECFSRWVFSGAVLKNINERQWNEDSLTAAKYILRRVLSKYLGDRPLNTRTLLADIL